MCEKANKKDSLWSKPITWFVIFTAITFVMTGFLFYNINAIHQDYKTQYKNFIEQIQKENPNAKITIINPTKPEDDFQKNFYTTQSNWLNAWIMLLALIFGVMGVAFPLLFTIKKKEIDDILKKSKKRLKDIEKRADEKLEQLEKAQEILDEINPKLGELESRICNTEDKIEKISYAKADENIEQLTSTTEPEDKNTEAAFYYTIGKKYAEKQQYKEAIDAYQEALKINPNLEGVQYNLSLAYQNLGLDYGRGNNTSEAIKYFKKAYKLTPKNAINCYNLGVAYGRIPNHKEAIKYAKEAIEIKKDYPEAIYNLATNYVNDKQFEKGLESIKRILDFAITDLQRDSWYNQLNRLTKIETDEANLETLQKIREIIAALPDKN